MEKIVKRVIPPVVTFLAGYLGGGLIGIPMNWRMRLPSLRSR